MSFGTSIFCHGACKANTAWSEGEGGSMGTKGKPRMLYECQDVPNYCPWCGDDEVYDHNDTMYCGKCDSLEETFDDEGFLSVNGRSGNVDYPAFTHVCEDCASVKLKKLIKKRDKENEE